jgi:hypothetical protein
VQDQIGLAVTVEGSVFRLAGREGAVAPLL